MIPVNELVERRSKLCSKLGPEPFVALVMAGEPKRRNGDVDYRFRADSGFLYLTGMSLPGAVLMLSGDGSTGYSSVVYAEANDPAREVWTGRKPSESDITGTSGVDHVAGIGKFESDLVVRASKATTLYLDIEAPTSSLCLTYRQQLASELLRRIPGLKLSGLDNIAAGLRMVKGPHELESLRRAVTITGEGLISILPLIRDGVNEGTIEAALTHAFAVRGGRDHGFPPIIAGGINATTLHYEANSADLASGGAVLMDVGAEYDGYTGDISRTVPVGGRFTGRFRELYQGLLGVQKRLVSSVAPGVTLNDLNGYARTWIGELLQSAGLITDRNDNDAVRGYYMHSVGHHLGLDAHDASIPGVPLEPGMVITIEPGIYVREEGIGIRIEDDVLVTSMGHENLSAGVPKGIDDLESFYQA